MAAMLEHIDRKALWEKIQRGDEFVLVDALSPMSYATSHLPGAVSMPPELVEELAPRRIPDRDAEVVVYCSSSTCDSSEIVATHLLELGYRHLHRYLEGKSDWAEAGLPLEGGRA